VQEKIQLTSLPSEIYLVGDLDSIVTILLSPRAHLCSQCPHDVSCTLWNPCPKDWWCGKYADRLSASMVTPRIRSYFWAAMGETSITKAMGGFVLDSRSLQPANSSVLCSWGADAGTLGMLCEPSGVAPDHSCIPGCRSGFQCGTQANLGDYCWWPPHQLKNMLELHEARPRTDDHGCNQWDCKYVLTEACMRSRKILHLHGSLFLALSHSVASTLTGQLQ
jgi:hypothetical protein